MYTLIYLICIIEFFLKKKKKKKKFYLYINILKLKME